MSSSPKTKAVDVFLNVIFSLSLLCIFLKDFTTQVPDPKLTSSAPLEATLLREPPPALTVLMHPCQEQSHAIQVKILKTSHSSAQ